MKTLRIALTGGGSGGHIYPLVAVAEKLEHISIEQKLLMQIRYFGSAGMFEPVLEEASMKISRVMSGKIRRYFSLMNIIDIPKIFIGFFQALFKLYFFMPDILFSKGGTGAFPIVLAAWLYRIPVLIHESDAQPGLNNLFSARFAKRIAVSFEKALEYFDPKKSACVGSPIRESLMENRPTQEAAKEEFGFNPGQPVILFWGGSQGAKHLNDMVLTDLKELTKDAQVLHQTGIGNFEEINNMAKADFPELMKNADGKNSYRPVPYFDPRELKSALSAADLVVARSGSNIFEMTAFSKPMILIPLAESANNHQKFNAYELKKAGAAKVIEETNLLPGIFLNEIKNLLKNKDLLSKMGLASGNFFKPQATQVITEEILRLLK